MFTMFIVRRWNSVQAPKERHVFLAGAAVSLLRSWADSRVSVL